MRKAPALVLVIAMSILGLNPALAANSGDLTKCLIFDDLAARVSGTTLTLTSGMHQNSNLCSLYTPSNNDFQPDYAIPGLGITCTGPALPEFSTQFAMPLGGLFCEGKVTKYGTSLDYLVVTNDGRSFSFPFRHEIIADPNPQTSSGTTGSTGSGGGSSTSTNGTTTTSPKPVGCTSAPEKPTISISWTAEGVLAKVNQSPTGQAATATYFSYTTYDVIAAKWDAWSDAIKFTQASGFSQLFYPATGKSRIAFEATSMNLCGISGPAREAGDKTGVPYSLQKKQEISVLPFYIEGDLVPNSIVDFYRAITSNLQPFGKAKFSIKSITPFICVTDSGMQAKLLSAGKCRISIDASPYMEYSDVKEYIYEFSVKRADATLSISSPSSISIAKKSASIAFNSNVTNVSLQFEQNTSSICWASQEGDAVIVDLIAPGLCQIGVILEDSEEFAGLEPVEIEFQVQAAPTSKTLLCTKGKIMKKITGNNPKCPAGYKVKK